MDFLTDDFSAGKWLVAYYIFNSLVQALPAPLDSGGRWYLFVYRFAHSLAGNWGLVVKEPKHE